MKSRARVLATAFAVCISASFLLAQSEKPAVLTVDQLKQSVPSTYFFRGQSATVQIRNSGGLRIGKDSLVLAALVDTGGYAQNIQQKYQGLFITEVKLNIGGSSLAPGEYGFGFSDGKFRVLDVASNELLAADFKSDDNLKRPVPLKLVEESGEYRLYAGRKYVAIKVE
ncbi:MAG TPA: hypothetical protein VLK33_11815 [Terriglobales bacterium]|nr:hypothetical protein [Terriglobales bacterium]